MFTTEIHLLTTFFPIKHTNALNCYVKDQMYCILVESNGERKVHKYPFTNIFRIVEDYTESQHD